MFFNFKIILIAIAATLVLTTGAYFYGRLDGSAACDARHKAAALDDFMKRTEEGNKLSSDLESEIANSRNFYIDLRREIDSEIASNNIYRDCIVPANGVFLANSAAQGRAAQ